MVKERLKYIAAAAFGAGAVLLATGTGGHLIALQSPNGSVRAHASDDQAQVSPTPEMSPSPETSPDEVAPAIVPAVTPTPDEEANEAVEDAQDADDAAEPAEAADPNDVNDDNGGGVAGTPAGQSENDDQGQDGSGSGGSGSGGHGSDDGGGDD